jgi:hypothetical protein
MYSPSFIASKAISAQDAAVTGRYDIAERKFMSVSSFISFNVAVSRASAGDARGRRIFTPLTMARHVSEQVQLKFCRATSPTATSSP